MQNKKNPKFSFVFLSLIRTSDLKVEVKCTPKVRHKAFRGTL